MWLNVTVQLIEFWYLIKKSGKQYNINTWYILSVDFTSINSKKYKNE